MAKAVTLKNKNNEEVYPVTDISLVNGAITSSRLDWTTVPKFYAYMNSSQNSFGNNTPIPYNTTEVNVGGFTLSGGRVTIPKAGYYRVEINIWANNTNRGWWGLYKNGTIYSDFINSVSSYSSASYSCIMQLNAGDIIDVRKSDGTLNLNQGHNDYRATNISISIV